MDEEAARGMPHDGASLKAEALRRCAGWHEPIESLLRATAPGDITGYPAYDRPQLRSIRVDGGASGDDRSRKRSGGASSDDGSGSEDDRVPERAMSERSELERDGVAVSSAPPHGRLLLPASSRVTLLGDACHPMSPFKGQGANQALIDAVALARVLRRSDLFGGSTPLGAALGTYEAEMLSRSAAKVAASAEAAAYLHSASATSASNCTRAAAARAASSCPHGS